MLRATCLEPREGGTCRQDPEGGGAEGVEGSGEEGGDTGGSWTRRETFLQDRCGVLLHYGQTVMSCPPPLTTKLKLYRNKFAFLN